MLIYGKANRSDGLWYKVYVEERVGIRPEREVGDKSWRALNARLMSVSFTQ